MDCVSKYVSAIWCPQDCVSKKQTFFNVFVFIFVGKILNLIRDKILRQKKVLHPPADSASPFCCHSGCISSSSVLNPSSSALPLLLLLFRDLLCANSPMPAEANLWAYASGVPGVSPRVLWDGRGFVIPEDSRERWGGELACVLDLRHHSELSDSFVQLVSCICHMWQALCGKTSVTLMQCRTPTVPCTAPW